MPFVRRLILGQNLRLTFSSKEKFLNDLLPTITKWEKEKFTSSTFESCNMCIVFFDLWMSRGGVDTFVLIIHFLNDKWKLYHVTIGFFETENE